MAKKRKSQARTRERMLLWLASVSGQIGQEKVDEFVRILNGLQSAEDQLERVLASRRLHEGDTSARLPLQRGDLELLDLALGSLSGSNTTHWAARREHIQAWIRRMKNLWISPHYDYVMAHLECRYWREKPDFEKPL